MDEEKYKICEDAWKYQDAGDDNRPYPMTFKYFKERYGKKNLKKRYDKFLEKLYAMDLLELRILEDFSEFEEGQIDEEEIDVEDTMSILTNYVDSVNTDIDKGTLKNVLRTLYIEAQNHTE